MTIFDLITGDTNSNLFAMNLRGCNGCGKSLVARTFIENSKEVEHIFVTGLKKQAYTYCKDYNLLLIGSYKNVCGGCDSLIKSEIVALLKMAWVTSANILFEGVLVSDSGKPYYYLLKEYNDTIRPRSWGFIYLDIPVEECLKRIYLRNGGKPIKEQLVADKHRNSLRYKQWQTEQGDGLITSVNANQDKKSVFSAVESVMYSSICSEELSEF